MGKHTKRVTEGSLALKAWIVRRELLQREAAELLRIDFTLLNHYLTGNRRPPLESAIKIERTTGIPVEAWVSSGDDTPSTPLVLAARKRK